MLSCHGSQKRDHDAIVRDSAGVLIIENAPNDELPVWGLHSEPLLEIGRGSGDPSHELYDVGGARRLPDGTVVVANSGTDELRFYAPDGPLLDRSGREGEGPGEFQGIVGLEVLGTDSLMVYDFRLRRVSILDLHGRFGRSFRVELPGGGLPLLESVTGPERRTLVVRDAAMFAMGQSGLIEDTVTYHLMNTEGGLEGSLGRYPGTRAWARRPGEGGFTIRTLPFGRRSRFATSASGFYESSAKTYDIGYYGLDGQLLRRVRLGRDPRPVTEDAIEAFQSAELAEADPERRPDLEAALAEVSYPETMPAHGALHVDAAGYLWVQDYRPEFEDEEKDWWRLFDPEGHHVAIAKLPSGSEIYQIGEKFILLGRQDDLGLEYVQLFRIDRGAGED